MIMGHVMVVTRWMEAWLMALMKHGIIDGQVLVVVMENYGDLGTHGR